MRAQAAKQHKADADARQVAQSQQQRLLEVVLGELGGEQVACNASQPPRQGGEAWVAQHDAEQHGVGRPEGGQQVRGAGEDAHQGEQEDQGGDTEKGKQRIESGRDLLASGLPHEVVLVMTDNVVTE